MSYWSPYTNTNTIPTLTSSAWREIGRVTLGAGSPTMTITVPTHRYYMLLYHTYGQASANDISHRIGEGTVISTGTYDRQYSENGAAATQSNDQTQGPNLNLSSANDFFGYTTIANISSEMKYLETHAVERNTAGDTNIVQRSNSRCKLPNTSINIDTLQLLTVSGANFNTGSELIVLGMNKVDLNKPLLYDLLASQVLGGTADNFTTSTLVARKYLYVQYFVETVTGQTDIEMTFNNDTGTNYNTRISQDGGADATLATQANIDLRLNIPAGDWVYGTMHIINDSSREKMVIEHHIYNSATGAATAPSRQELTAKWDNVASQITEIDLTNADAGNFNTGSFIKVWGAN